MKTGIPLSEHWKNTPKPLEGYNLTKIALMRDREELYRRSDERVDRMMKDGLLDEVKALADKGFNPDMQSASALGYRHLLEHLKKNHGLEEFLALFKRDTRRFIKRQTTWISGEKSFELKIF